MPEYVHIQSTVLLIAASVPFTTFHFKKAAFNVNLEHYAVVAIAISNINRQKTVN